MSEQAELIIIHESITASLITDFGQVLAAVALIGVGWWADSSAMQWAGFVFWIVTIVARASGRAKRCRKTPQETADYLNTKFNVKAQ